MNYLVTLLKSSFGIKTITIITGAMVLFSGCENNDVTVNPANTFEVNKLAAAFDSSEQNLQRLSQKYAPILYFHPDENYMMTSVEWYLDRTIAKKIPSNESFSPASKYIIGTATNDVFNLAIDKNYTRFGDLSSAKVYVNVKNFADTKGYIDIQYWFFYAYNGGGHGRVAAPIIHEFGTHEADWEHITVRVDANTSEMVEVYFAQHSWGEWVTDLTKLERVGDRFNVYSSWDGHASFYTPGLHSYYINLMNECERGESLDSASKLEMIGINGILTPKYAYFKNINAWGDDGPSGPNNKGSWITKADGLGETEIHAIQYDTGEEPTLAITKDSKIIEIHNGGGNNNLYYSVGTLNNNSSISWLKKGMKYDTGDRPTATIAQDGRIIEIHNGGGNNNLYYSVGSLNSDNSINWLRKGSKYDTGNMPTVTIAPNGRIVELHNGGGNNNLYYSVGTLNNDNSITWIKKGIKYDTGNRPTAAITADGIIVEVHNGGGNDNLYYNIGLLNNDSTITWKTIGTKYDTGDSPSITITKDGWIKIIYNGANIEDTGGELPVVDTNLYYSLGRLNDNKTIDWLMLGESYDEGQNPATAIMPSGKLIEVHGNMNNNNLYYNTLVHYLLMN